MPVVVIKYWFLALLIWNILGTLIMLPPQSCHLAIRSPDLSEIDTENRWFKCASSIWPDFVDKIAHCLFTWKYIYTYLFIWKELLCVVSSVAYRVGDSRKTDALSVLYLFNILVACSRSSYERTSDSLIAPMYSDFTTIHWPIMLQYNRSPTNEQHGSWSTWA